MKKQNIIAIVIFALIAVIVIAQSKQFTSSEESTGTSTATGIQIGDKAPDFTLTDINGQTVSLSDFEGQQVIVNFWTSWCGPCLEEMPNFQKFHETYPDVVLLTINCNPEDSIEEFVTNNGYTFPVLLDSGEVQQAYGITGYPETFVINEDGIVVDKIVGSMTYEMMEEKFLDIQGGEL